MPAPTLRPCRPDDIPAMIRLFRETIHTVNRRDYSPAQLAAWAPEQIDEARWRAKLATQDGVIAEIDGQMAGYCTWDTSGYVDLLYVHYAFQRRGVATAVHGAAEQALRTRGVKLAHTQASVTAQPFFLRQGYRLVRHQIVHVRGVDLPNAIMEKVLE